LGPEKWELVVTLNKESYPVTAAWGETGFVVELETGKTMTLNTDWLVGEPMMLAEINDNEVAVQVLILRLN